MSPWIVWWGGFFLVLCGGAFGAMRLARSTGTLERLSKSVGLPVTDEVRPMVELAEQNDLLSRATGVGVAVAVGFVVLAATHVTQSFEIFYGYFLVVLVGLGIGTTASVIRGERRRQAGILRFARGRAVTRDDYQSKLWQWAPRVTVVLFLVGLVGRALITPNPTRDIPLFVFIYAAVAIATLVLAEVGSRWMIGHGQPAGSALGLAWDDAVKGRALYSLVFIPLYLGAFGSQMGSALALPIFGEREAYSAHSTIEAGVRHMFTGGLLFQDAIGIAAILFLLVATIVDNASGPQRRYLRRLWPDLAKDLAATESDRYAVEAEANAARNNRRKDAKAAAFK